MSLEVGSIVEGKVTGITNFGAFVELSEGVTGLAHLRSRRRVRPRHQRLPKKTTRSKSRSSYMRDGKIGLSHPRQVNQGSQDADIRAGPGGARRQARRNKSSSRDSFGGYARSDAAVGHRSAAVGLGAEAEAQGAIFNDRLLKPSSSSFSSIPGTGKARLAGAFVRFTRSTLGRILAGSTQFPPEYAGLGMDAGHPTISQSLEAAIGARPRKRHRRRGPVLAAASPK